MYIYIYAYFGALHSLRQYMWGYPFSCRATMMKTEAVSLAPAEQPLLQYAAVRCSAQCVALCCTVLHMLCCNMCCNMRLFSGILGNNPIQYTLPFPFRGFDDVALRKCKFAMSLYQKSYAV